MAEGFPPKMVDIYNVCRLRFEEWVKSGEDKDFVISKEYAPLWLASYIALYNRVTDFSERLSKVPMPLDDPVKWLKENVERKERIYKRTIEELVET